MTTIYTPESLLRHPGRLLGEMLRDLCGAKELAFRLFVRDVQAQYRQSLTGFLWAFVPPVLTTLLFVYLAHSRGFETGDTGVPYVVYVTTGLLFWQAMMDAISQPLRFLDSAKVMLVKISFPREAILMAATGVVLLNHAIRFIILLAVFAITQTMPDIASLSAGFFAAFPLVLMGLIISLCLSPLTLLFRDISQGLILLFGIILFITPVGYALPADKAVPWYVEWNPVAHLLQFGRDAMLHAQFIPEWPVLIITIAGMGLLLVGWIIFRLALPLVFERIGGA